MNLYGPTPTANDIAYNKEEWNRPVPKEDGIIDGKRYWNCTRNNVTYKIGFGENAFGNYFTYIFGPENQMIEHVMRYLTPTDTSVVDCGSSHGSWTLPFLCSGHPVYSFELEPVAFHEMMGHIRLNSDIINPTHINCYNFGLYSNDMRGDFYDMKNLHFRRLDDVLQEVNDCKFYKLDVEGAELEVMKGGTEFLKRNEPSMWIECHEIFNKGIKERVITYIKELGFKNFTIREFDLGVKGCKYLLVAKDTN